MLILFSAVRILSGWSHKDRTWSRSGSSNNWPKSGTTSAFLQSWAQRETREGRQQWLLMLVVIDNERLSYKTSRFALGNQLSLSPVLKALSGNGAGERERDSPLFSAPLLVHWLPWGPRSMGRRRGSEPGDASVRGPQRKP